MNKKMLFFVNPKAGQMALQNNLLEVLQVFTAGGYDVTVHPTMGVGDLTQWITQYGTEYDMVVCAGGDGTLNEAVSGLMQIGNRPPLGYIPGGTVNDVAATLGLKHNPVEAARDIINGSPFALDIGSFGENRWFTYVAGFGAFTAVSYKTPQYDKRIFGRMAYLFNGVKSLGEIKPIPVRITVNDQVIEDEVLVGLVCSSTSVAGFRPKLNTEVSLNDGLSEVIVAKKMKTLADLNALGTLLMKGEFDPNFFYTFQTDRVQFEFPDPVSWTLDGEFGGTLQKIELKNNKQAVEIIVPSNTLSKSATLL